MTAGLPGAGIGGLFYLASTVLLPVRSFLRWCRGEADDVTWRQHVHHVAMAVGIIGALWITGWLLALIVPREILAPAADHHAGSHPARTVLSVATLGVALGTLATVLVSVEVARVIHVRRLHAERAMDGDFR